MSQPPPASLLRLREADVVRLCGLVAAAAGLEAATRHAVLQARREGGRLDAVVVVGEQQQTVWVEFTDEGDSARWGCNCPVRISSAPGLPACSHVAALLATWIRDPDIFTATDTTAPPAQPRPMIAPPSREPPSVQVRSIPPQRPVPVPASRGPLPLSEELARLPTRELLAIAQRVFSADLPEREARIRLVETLSDPILLSVLLAKLDTGANTLLSLLTLLGGVTTATDLEGVAVRSGHSPSAVREDATVLERHGLLFRAVSPLQPADARDEPRRALTGWRVPQEIRTALAPLLPLDQLPAHGHGPPVLTSAAEKQQTLRWVPGSPRPLGLALALLARAPGPLSSVRPATETRQPHIPAGGVRTFAWLPGDLPPDRLRALARSGGLEVGAARLARRVLLLASEQAEGQPITDLASAPPAERHLVLRAGFRLWANAGVPAELGDLTTSGANMRARYDAAHPTFTMPAIGEECATGRRFVLRLLRFGQPGVWYTLDSLLDLVWRLRPLFLRGRQQTYSAPMWWLERDGQVLRPNIHEEWLAGEGSYLHALLTGPLHEWGALDLAFDAERTARAFRLTPFGLFLLGQDGAPDQPEIAASLRGKWGPALLPTREGTLAVQPLAADAALLGALGQWARPTSIAGGRLIFTLSADLACAAFDRGAEPDDLVVRLRALETPGGPRAAETLAPRLAEWRAAYGQTRIETAWALLEARDTPALAEALAAAPDIAARCRRIGDTFALVPTDDLAALQKTLARRGYQL